MAMVTIANTARDDRREVGLANPSQSKKESGRHKAEQRHNCATRPGSVHIPPSGIVRGATCRECGQECEYTNCREDALNRHHRCHVCLSLREISIELSTLDFLIFHIFSTRLRKTRALAPKRSALALRPFRPAALGQRNARAKRYSSTQWKTVWKY